MFNNLNSVLLEGNLVKDPELEYTAKGTAYCKFSIASNRFYKQDKEYLKEVSFFDVITWSKQAEICGEYLTKGRGVRLVGRIKQDRWQGPDGKQKSKISVIADHVEFKPSFKKDDQKNDSENHSTRTPEKEPVF